MRLKRPNLKTLPALLLWLAFAITWRVADAAAADAVVLQLRNGDRLTGAIISENAKEVVLSTVRSKEVRVPALSL